MGPLTELGNLDLQHQPAFQMGPLITIAVIFHRRDGQLVYTEILLRCVPLSSSNTCLGTKAMDGNDYIVILFFLNKELGYPDNRKHQPLDK